MTELLFSYGTLQLEKVQMESFGRMLTGHKDTLHGYKLTKVEITDPKVLAQSDQQFHPIAIPSTNTDDKIDGVVFEITKDELTKADEYEVDDYTRVKVTLDSGKSAWMYVDKAYARIKDKNQPPSKDPLHGLTLEKIVTHLMESYGWETLGQQIRIKCFTDNPSVQSSLKFLRKTPWARTKVEDFYKYSLRKKKLK
jgi:gamma-glutamylcyclotransferase (GGCT)/AIG2-like uncharacterized protein YtfP